MSEKVKKPFYKKWWFWVIAVILIIGLATPSDDSNKTAPANSTPSESKPTAENNANQEEKNEQAEATDPVPEQSAPTEPEQLEFVNTAVATELFTGEFEVGVDVEPGRYIITSDDGSGNLFVYKGGIPVVNEILSKSIDDTFGIGVTRIEVDLEAGQTIEISGINRVLLHPAIIDLRTELPTGMHLVGRDVPAGSYIATAPNGSGNFIVYNKSGMPKINEILGKDDFGLAVEKIKLTVKDGDTIHISGIELVELN